MKLFSLEEANALLPTLRRLLARIDAERRVIKQLEPEARRAAAHATENGGTVYGIQYAASLSRFMQAVQEIFGLGIEIKDFDRGLCDFPHWRDGRVVYLCWKKDEDSVEWWHDTDTGFAGRRPL